MQNYIGIDVCPWETFHSLDIPLDGVMWQTEVAQHITLSFGCGRTWWAKCC